MAKKRRRIVVVQEDNLQAAPVQHGATPGTRAVSHHADAELGASPAESRRSRKERNRKTNSSKQGKKKKVASRDPNVSSPLQQSVSNQQEVLCIQVLQSSCCECGAFKLVRGTLEQRWSSELSMYGSVIYQLIALGGDGSGNTCLRIDACHFERGGSQLFDIQFLKPDSRSWCSGTLSVDTSGWRLALSDGNTLTIESEKSLDWLEIARFDADLPYGTDCRLSIPRANLTSSIDTIAPGLPAQLRTSLAQAQMRGCGSLFFSGIAFARHLALSSLPAASLLPHAAFLLNLDVAPFESVKRWTPRSVIELLRRHSDTSEKPSFRPVYGNVQAKKYHTKGFMLGVNEVLIAYNIPSRSCSTSSVILSILSLRCGLMLNRCTTENLPWTAWHKLINPTSHLWWTKTIVLRPVMTLLHGSIRNHMRWTGATFMKCRRRKHCGWDVRCQLQKSCRAGA